jgi:4-amino-4-deoxy-L-arabinose transferase-like glycosyltransferase
MEFGAIVVLISALMAVCPIFSLVQIGPDEHYEVEKALLWSKGYPLYTRVWNDQPPVYSVLLGTIFNLFGPTIIAARVLALGFGLSLFTACFVLVKKRSGFFAAGVASFCLLVAPEVFKLSISAMLEVPAIGTGLWALWANYRWTEDPKLIWLAWSGLLLATALQIKLTAAIVVPALVTEILLGAQKNWPTGWVKKSVLFLGIWLVAITVPFFLIGAIFGAGYGEAWQSHFSGDSRHAASQLLAFSFSKLSQHPEGLWGAIAGLCVAALRREWRQVASPTVLLGTVMAVHCFHRPFWDYYYLHFAVPLAWLGGYGAVNLVRFALNGGQKGFFRPPFIRLLSHLIGTVLISMAISYGGIRLMSDIYGLRNMPRIDGTAVILKMKEFASRTKWVYADSDCAIYSFHAGLPVIPELAVLPRKRFWSKQINDDEIAAIVREYKPEQIVLVNGWSNSMLQSLIDSRYEEVFNDASCSLHFEKSLMKRK